MSGPASQIAQAGTTPPKLTRAVPTDTVGVLSRLLKLSEAARRQKLSAADNPLLPAGIAQMLLRAMKIVDPGLISHGQRIAAISSGVAQLLGWNDEQRRQLELAALLHDLGKIGVPRHILHKPGKLGSDEYDLVNMHHQAAVCLLQALHADPSLISLLTLLHHDFDGAGPQLDLAEHDAPQELPLGPRILAVADAYDSLSSPKAYRRAMTHSETIAILEERSGSRYDGNIVRTLNRWYEQFGSCLFEHADPFQSPGQSADVPAEFADEIGVLTQILGTLYQFQSLYDGYYLLDQFENYCIWNDGMPGISGLPVQNVLGRSFQSSDVPLYDMTTEFFERQRREQTIIHQAFLNGRPQFSSKIVHASEQRHAKVDVYTLPVVETDDKVVAVLQLIRCKGGIRKQTKEYVELKLAATRDALTGVANRGQLETQLRHLLEEYHAQEATGNLSVIFLDVDKFKRINDNYGHQTGDQVLVDLTRLLQHETYSGEIIGRYGGEEFVVICPDTDIESAIRRAERLRHAVSQSSIGGVSTLSVTSSFGVATAHYGDSVQTLLERADTCLYKAKETGRNKTCWEGQPDDAVEAAAQLEAQSQEEDGQRIRKADKGFVFQDEIYVSTSLELTAMKIQAFLSHGDLKVTRQEQGVIQIRSGSLGMRFSWGTTSERQPVDIELRFQTRRVPSDEPGGQARTIRYVEVEVRSIGRVSRRDDFEVRCLTLMQVLKSYLLSR